MPKVIITDPKGLYFNRVVHPQGAELELSGPRLEAALHFKQVERVKEEPAKAKKPEKSEPEKK